MSDSSVLTWTVMPPDATRPDLLAEELADQPVLSRLSSTNSEPGTKSRSSASSLPVKFANSSLTDHDNLADDIPKPISITSFLFRFVPFLHNKSASPIDLDAIATKRSVYDDPNLAQYYWPKENYENLHRFDVTARWTIREERVSSYICLVLIQSGMTHTAGFGLENRLESYALEYVQLWNRGVFENWYGMFLLIAAISFSALNLDRSNIAQANTDNFLPDLGMITDGRTSFLLNSHNQDSHLCRRLQLG